MISYYTGNIFDIPAYAIVNPVNCVGVSGKGLALEFKRRYPNNFECYRRVCEKGLLSPGKVFIYPLDNSSRPTHIVNFPTKRHWRDNSNLKDIESGLRALQYKIRYQYSDWKSIAIPCLGCGCGNLNESDAVPKIVEIMKSVAGIETIIALPKLRKAKPIS